MNNMKRLMLLTFMSITLASLTATAGAQTKNAAPENAESTQEIRAWLDRWTNAFTKQDVDSIMALYTDDVVAYDIVPPLQYIGKAAYRADYQQFFSQYEGNLHVEVRDLHVGATGDPGYAAGWELFGGPQKNVRRTGVCSGFTPLFRRPPAPCPDFHVHAAVTAA